MTALLFPTSELFEFEARRVLGHAAYGGADLGEVLATVGHITAGDADGWHDAWLAMADAVAGDGDAARAAGHRTSARDAYRRASTYYRAADFFLHGEPDDPRIGHAHRRARATYGALVELSDHIEHLRVPYEGAELQGHLHWPTGPRRSLPVLLLHNGFDGAAEEMDFFGAAAAAERGFLAVTFDGPGQPSALRDHGLVFRPDWEHVVAAVLDGLLADHAAAVDPHRIALLGLSLGGYLAPRAAAFEDRIAAVVAVDGVYDATSTFYDALGLERDELVRLLHDEPAALADRLRAAAAVSPSLRWILDHGRYAFGVDTDLDLLAAHLRYNLLDGVAERIRCPVLVCSAEADHFFGGSATRPPEPARLVEHLRAPASLLELGRDRGAEGHCHSGAQRHALARILDWLEESLATRAPSPSGASLTRVAPSDLPA